MQKKYVVALGVATLALTAGVGASYAAGPSHKDLKAKTIKVSVKDPSGDVVAKTGDLSEIDPNSTGIDPFKPGEGTMTTPTADDNAIDLQQVTYKLVRIGKKPALTITYTASGPFSFSHTTSQTSTTYDESDSADGFVTYLAHGYEIDAADTGHAKDSGLFVTKSDKRVKCAGFSFSAPKGASVATATVPLACFAQVHLTSSTLTSLAGHAAETVHATSTGSLSGSASAAWDRTSKTRVLPLTAK